VPTDTEIAWAAGLFEGEGSFIVHHNRRYGGASLATTDRDVLDRFQAIVGFGNIYAAMGKAHGAGVAAGTRKQCYQWSGWSAVQVRQLIDLFWPYLGERRRARALEVRAATEGIGSRGRSKHQTHCKRGHEFTEENTIRQPNPLSPKGWTRNCRECRRMRVRARRALDQEPV
jgi:hypothetical protein